MANVNDTRKGNTPAGTSVPTHHETSHTDEARDKAQEVGTQIRDKAQEVGTQIRDTAQEVGTQIRDKAQEVGTQAQELGTRAQEAVAEYYVQGREGLQEFEQTLEARIREKPLQSIMIAGGVGLLLGLLWRRS